MNDIVITYNKNFNTEGRLKQIIRAVENECEGYNEIYIVGEKPDWIQGVIHIDFSDMTDKKHYLRHQFRKLKAVCLNRNLTENFYWIDANDKIAKFDARKALRVSIDESSNFFQRPKGTDKIAYEHTSKIMKRRGFNYGNFFNDFPISLNKSKLTNTFDEVDFETLYGYCIKTLYCNFNRLKPTHEYMSSLDLTNYNRPSTYEITI